MKNKPSIINHIPLELKNQPPLHECSQNLNSIKPIINTTNPTSRCENPNLYNNDINSIFKESEESKYPNQSIKTIGSEYHINYDKNQNLRISDHPIHNINTNNKKTDSKNDNNPEKFKNTTIPNISIDTEITPNTFFTQTKINETILDKNILQNAELMNLKNLVTETGINPVIINQKKTKNTKFHTNSKLDPIELNPINANITTDTNEPRENLISVIYQSKQTTEPTQKYIYNHPIYKTNKNPRFNIFKKLKSIQTNLNSRTPKPTKSYELNTLEIDCPPNLLENETPNQPDDGYKTLLFSLYKLPEAIIEPTPINPSAEQCVRQFFKSLSNKDHNNNSAPHEIQTQEKSQTNIYSNPKESNIFHIKHFRNKIRQKIAEINVPPCRNYILHPLPNKEVVTPQIKFSKVKNPSKFDTVDISTNNCFKHNPALRNNLKTNADEWPPPFNPFTSPSASSLY